MQLDIKKRLNEWKAEEETQRKLKKYKCLIL